MGRAPILSGFSTASRVACRTARPHPNMTDRPLPPVVTVATSARARRTLRFVSERQLRARPVFLLVVREGSRAGAGNTDLIDRNWADVLRVAATMAAGTIRPSQITRDRTGDARPSCVSVHAGRRRRRRGL